MLPSSEKDTEAGLRGARSFSPSGGADRGGSARGRHTGGTHSADSTMSASLYTCGIKRLVIFNVKSGKLLKKQVREEMLDVIEEYITSLTQEEVLKTHSPINSHYIDRQRH